MQYGNGYWNIKELLPYQRNFNFVNSVRSKGKTYTTAGFTIERFLTRGEQTLFIVRTVDEKKQGALKKWYEKVISLEFPQYEFEFTGDTMWLKDGNKREDWKIVAECRALSEAIKVKKQSFPKVKWMVMDEYMLEPKHSHLYVQGFDEPDLLLNIYHTVDREQDKVVCFMLGNNTAFYNPYHLHPAFQIPPVQPGEIWKSENVLFQWWVPDEENVTKQKKSKFLRMIEGTKYGRYAADGEYIGDNFDLVEARTNRANYIFCFRYNTTYWGVWYDWTVNLCFISMDFNRTGVRLSLDDTADGKSYIASKKNSLIKWLGKKYIDNAVRFESMEVKIKVEQAFSRKIL